MIKKFKEILNQDDTVLFIGSGVSLWSKLPSWKGLIEELIKFLNENGLDSTLTEQELKKGDLLQAASYGFDNLTKPKFAEFIRNSCRLGIAKPHEIHHKIISLGPTCYITTNYDNLMEQSFNKWIPEKHFRKVVNRQLTETAEIVGARASNFLFKLHGDAEDSESIILTREQYRTLNFGGDLYYALEATKTLMLSRPIVYIGFGLRDPDFLLLKDLLINTYKGGARDHYAIMPDVSDQEKDYWRRNFGIYIIDYKTVSRADGTKDHTPLLKLLDKLCSAKPEKQTATSELTPEIILTLNRHAAKYSSFEISNSHLPLVVYPMESLKNGRNRRPFFRYYGMPVEELLDNGPEKLILIGPPGGGKSYSLKGSVARISKKLIEECIDDTIKKNKTIVPIYVDLKLYQGSIIDLIEQNIPVRMTLKSLCSNFMVKLYLDAFNEIPKEYIESNHWKADFNVLLNKFCFALVISSRTSDGLEDLEFLKFSLDSIDYEFVKTNLIKNNFNAEGIFANEIINLLQRPLFYNLILKNNFSINSETTPKNIYMDMLNFINQKFNDKFKININLTSALSKAAMDALDSGEEAYKTEILKKYMEIEMEQNKAALLSSSDITNWLVGQNFLVPVPNERISFFHQSITEYLAATRLAETFADNNEILKEKLSYRRWDQALFLALSLLKRPEADKFLEMVIQIDFELAVSSVKYLEEDTTEIVQRLLEEIDTTISDDFDRQMNLSFMLKDDVPLSDFHIPILKKLISKGDFLGGSAAGCLLRLLKNDFKNDVMALLVDYCDDYNFCMEIGRSLKEYITADDIPALFALTLQVQEKLDSGKNKKYGGFDSALSDLMEGFAPQLVFKTFFDPAIPVKKQKVRLKILRWFLYNCRNNESLKISMDLLLAGVKNVAFVIYANLSFFDREDAIDYSIFNSDHVKTLLSIVKCKGSNSSGWALDALYSIFLQRIDLIPYVRDDIQKSSGILKSALHYSISAQKGFKLVFESLKKLLSMDSKDLSEEPFELITHMKYIDWIGHEKLFISLIKMRNKKLTQCLCDDLGNTAVYTGQVLFDIGPIYWWLDWLAEFLVSKDKNWMFIDRVSGIISNCVPVEKRQEFINEFNKQNSKYREVISKTILPKFNDLTLSDFTEESIAYLINDIKNIELYNEEEIILANIATETFVYHRLIPLLKVTKGKKQKNIKKLIEIIGKQHERRYLVE